MTTNNKPAHTPEALIDGGDGSVWQYRPEIDADRAIVLPSQYIVQFPDEAKRWGKLFTAAPLMAEALKKLTEKSPYAEERGTEFCIFCMMRDWQNHADDCPFILGKAALLAAGLNDENEGAE